MIVCGNLWLGFSFAPIVENRIKMDLLEFFSYTLPGISIVKMRNNIKKFQLRSLTLDLINIFEIYLLGYIC